MTITISQKFLDDAAYPDYCDPTLGYTTLGASLIGAENAIFAEIGAPADGNGTVDSISLGIEIGIIHREQITGKLPHITN